MIKHSYWSKPSGSPYIYPAVIIECNHPDCHTWSEFRLNNPMPDDTDLKKMARDAKAHFEESGWVSTTSNDFCPSHTLRDLIIKQGIKK